MATARIYRIGKAIDNDWIVQDSQAIQYHAEIFIDPNRNVFFSPLAVGDSCTVDRNIVREPLILQTDMVLRIGSEVIDWENKLFGKKPLSFVEPAILSVQDKRMELGKENIQLIVIYSLIALLLLILLLII